MDAFGQLPSVTDGVQLSPISYRFITDVNTRIKSTDFLRRNSIMIIDPQSGYLARLIASGGEF